MGLWIKVMEKEKKGIIGVVVYGYGGSANAKDCKVPTFCFPGNIGER
jgi:hypothetical protein